MNWIRDNKFLAAFLGVLVVGCLALGVLIFLASGHYSEVTATYDKQLNELQRLEGLKPYPNAGNLEKVNQQKGVYADEVMALRRQLSDQTFPLSETSPSQFQDRLRQAVGDVVSAATDSEVELDADFYLGFDVYQAQPPKSAAAAPLARELESVKLLSDILIKAGVDRISIERTPLAVESGEPPAAERGQALVVKHPVLFNFQCDPRVLRDVLNRISGADKFFIIRTLNVQNTAPEGPARGATATESDSPEQALESELFESIDLGTEDFGSEDDADTVTETARMEFVVGSEKLDVSMLVEIVDFAPVESGAKATTTGA